MNLDCFSYWMDAMDARLTHGLLIKSIPASNLSRDVFSCTCKI